MTKVMNNIQDALSFIESGHTVLVGGFGLIGAPLSLIDGLTEKEVRDLTIVSNNLGESGKGLGILLNQNKIKKGIGSYFTSNRDVGDKYQKGEIELELLPQGTLAESLRAGGAGLGGYYTTTGVGTDLAKGKEEREIDGVKYILEKAIRADVALIRAHKADTLGNLMATAAKKVIVEVDEVVEPGALNPEEIVTPFLFIDAIVIANLVLTKEGVVAK
jgi:3-oxoacid CoA-transferase subunit A